MNVQNIVNRTTDLKKDRVDNMENKTVKYPCRGCVYFNACGENTRTEPCKGRMTKSEKKAQEKADKRK